MVDKWVPPTDGKPYVPPPKKTWMIFAGAGAAVLVILVLYFLR